jgi:hypothetical protein
MDGVTKCQVASGEDAIKEKFNNGTRLLLNAVKTCRENPRIIEYKAVTLMKKIDYIVKMKMLDLARFFIEMHKP